MRLELTLEFGSLGPLRMAPPG